MVCPYPLFGLPQPERLWAPLPLVPFLFPLSLPWASGWSQHPLTNYSPVGLLFVLRDASSPTRFRSCP